MVKSGKSHISGRCCLLFVLMLCISIYGSSVIAQDITRKASRQAAIEAFNEGRFEEAYNNFHALLQVYPKDPLYKYYSGVSLVKLERNPGEAVNLLKQSLQGTTVARSIPSDALFWLGRAQQMSGMFGDAVSSFESYASQAGRKAVRDSGVDDFIQQCKDKKGAIIRTEPVAASPAKEPALNIKQENETASRKQVAETRKEGKESIPEDYDIILSEAMKYQVKSDSLYKEAENMKKDLGDNNYKDKAGLKTSIARTENLAASFQKQADQRYAEAQAAMNAKPFTGKEVSPAGSQQKQDTSKSVKMAAPAAVSEKPVNAKQNSDLPTEKKDIVQKPVEVPVIKNDSSLKALTLNGETQTIKKVQETFSVFEIEENPVYAPDQKTEINPVIPKGLIYRIQVAVFRNAVAPSFFKGITPVYGFKVAGTDRTNYYAGMFRRYADAASALPVIRKRGFKDAFIVCFFEGKAISRERAGILEKEWGIKPFFTEIEDSKTTPADTIPPTLSFRVEIMRAQKPPKDDIIEGMTKIAGTKGLDTVTLQDGTIVYLIGNFITFESAEEYADLLARNGYREAKVSAWLGSREIPVETAKQLFEKIE